MKSSSIRRLLPDGQSLDRWLSLLEQLKGMMTVS